MRAVKTAVILAAGAGTRMGVLGARIPKPLLPVGNRPLIRRHLDLLRDSGITRAWVVIGHQGWRIVRHLSEDPVPGLAIDFAEQEQRFGIAHALGRLEQVLDEPFLLLLGDIAFEAPDLRSGLLTLPEDAAALLAVKDEPDIAAIRRNFSVRLGDGDTVVQVEEKPRHPPNRLKGCGLYVFTPDVFAAIRATPRTAARDEYEITDSLQIMIDRGMRVLARSVVTWDANLTTPADLLACNLRHLAQAGVSRLLGRDVTVPDAAHIEDSVIGDGAVVEHPIAITRSLVLPGATVRTREPLRNAVAIGTEVLQC